MKIIRLIKIIDHMDHFFDFFGGGDAKFLPGELFLTLTTRPYLEFCSSEPESCSYLLTFSTFLSGFVVSGLTSA